MNKSLLLILIIHLSLQKASADTVDFFHVFYNDKLILESGVLSYSTITLSLQELQDTDTLMFNYFNDSGKYDLVFGCVLKSGNSALFRATQQLNSGDYAIPISVIKQSFLKTGNNELEVWYYNKLHLKITLLPEIKIIDHTTPTIKTIFVTERNGAVIYLDTINKQAAINNFNYGSKLEILSESKEWYSVITNEDIVFGNNILYGYKQVYVPKNTCGPYYDIHLNTEELQSTIHPYFLGEDNDTRVRTDYETFFSLALIDSATFHQQLKSAVSFIIYDTLSNKKQNGKTVLYCTQQLLRFVDDTTNTESHSTYTYIGQLPALDQYLLEGQFYEEMSYFFIDKQTGNTTASFYGMPYLSPDKKSIFTLDSNPYEMLGELVLYQLNSDNTITHRASIFFDQWMPSPKGKIFWGADGNLYFNANTTATFWDETGNFPTRFDYIKLTPTPNN